MTAILDKFFGKWASRKLIVFLIATILVILGKISGSEWVYIAGIYTLVQGVIDATVYYKNK